MKKNEKDRKFAVGVGYVYMFDDDGQLLGTASTLTNLTLNKNASFQDVKAGPGYKKVFRYATGDDVTVSLTDAEWNWELLALTTNSDVGLGAEVFREKKIEFVNGVGVLPIPAADDKQYVYFAGETVKTPVGAGDTITLDDLTFNGYRCCRYWYFDKLAAHALVGSNPVPKIVKLVITQPLASTKGVKNLKTNQVGEVQYTIPLFQFDGNETVSAAADNYTPTNLSGVALAADEDGNACGEAGGYYYERNVSYYYENWYDAAVKIFVLDAENGEIELSDGDTELLSVGAVLSYIQSKTYLCSNDEELTFAVLSGDATVDASGTVTGGTVDSVIEISATGKPELNTQLTIKAV